MGWIRIYPPPIIPSLIRIRPPHLQPSGHFHICRPFLASPAPSFHLLLFLSLRAAPSLCLLHLALPLSFSHSLSLTLDTSTHPHKHTHILSLFCSIC
ncbi:hypothetical protein M431DRAFT_252021 [Trichoderma harzianum CBS 226.95]|uniref:Uncharacterized protein n=1 Tax=Trichoderma harzianum CBS 226.95 TaxID=983964 RepID=A0A2T4A037_TRIHA|nr:hypothetical protein M431DRAFT_252021 [Trichoderma harzianum CBS 226.95]PTB50388.1 hypothetical protein M431DRAFT_252021 [Trichoderma harzianum CBS 226.95]